MFRTPLPTAITSLAESPLTPVSWQPFSNASHGPAGRATDDHRWPFQCSVSMEPSSRPTAQTLAAEIAVTLASGAKATLL